MSAPLRVDLPVRWNAVDYARVMYFPKILDMVHVAMEEFFARAVGKSYADVIGEGLGFPTVHLDCDFRRPFRLGDVASFAIDVTELGRRKVVFRHRVSNGDELAAEVTQVTVCVDPEAFVSRDLPDAYRAALTRYLASDA